MTENYNAMEILNHCKHFIRGMWLDKSVDDIEITPLKGGLSNYLVVAELKNVTKSKPNDIVKVLVRIYGELRKSDPHLLLQDAVIYAYLSERGFLPKLYGIFREGRLEEFLEPSRLLTLDEIRQPIFSNDIARQMFHIHQINLPLDKRIDNFGLTLLKMLDEIMETLSLYEANDEKTVSLLKNSYRNRAIETLKYFRDNPIKEETMKLHKMIFEDFHDDLCLVFSHNDIHSANVLCVPDETSQLPGKIRLQIIDYEWSSYNIRGYDIGFFLNEFAFNYLVEDWPCYSYDASKLPSEELRMAFLKAYFAESSTPNILDDPKELFKIKREVKFGTALCQIFSAIWLFNQCLYSDVEFGFLEQGILRYELFLKDMDDIRNHYLEPSHNI